MNSLLPSRRVLLEAVVLVMAALAAGLSFNYSLVMKAFSGQSLGAPTQVATTELATELLPLPVAFEELDALLASGYRFVDAREPEIYRDAHLPGALSLPLGEVDPLLDRFVDRVPLETPLITYCNGFGCPDSFDLGVRLLTAGYTRVLVYEGGFPEWRDRGLPLERGEGP